MARKGFIRRRNEDIIKAYKELEEVEADIRPINEMTPEEIENHTYYTKNADYIKERYNKCIKEPVDNAWAAYFGALSARDNANPITAKKVEAMIAKEKRKLELIEYRTCETDVKPEGRLKRMSKKISQLWGNRSNLLEAGKERFKRDVKKAEAKSIKAMKHVAVKGRVLTIKGAMKVEELKEKREKRREKRKAFFAEIDAEAKKQIEEQKSKREQFIEGLDQRDQAEDTQTEVVTEEAVTEKENNEINKLLLTESVRDYLGDPELEPEWDDEV